MKKATWVLVLAACAARASAQAPVQEERWAEVNALWAVPQGNFADRSEDAGMGIAVLFGGRVPRLPFVLGTELGLLSYGRDARLEVYDVVVPVEVVSVATSNHVAMGHLMVRLQPAGGLLMPYVDVVGGLRYFINRTHFEGDVAFDDEDLRGVATAADVALSYGAGGGLDLRLFTGPTGWDERPTTVSLHAGVRYLFGGKARYRGDGTLQRASGRADFTLQESRTDLLVGQFGLRVKL
jgi:hypothetical protein